jgi:hypothetical protein
MQVHILHGGLSCGRDRGAAGELRRSGPRQPVPRHVPGAAQQAQRHFLLSRRHSGHHAALHPSVPAHVPSHVCSEEEGSGRGCEAEKRIDVCFCE